MKQGSTGTGYNSRSSISTVAVIQKTFNVAVLPRSAVQLFFVDDEPLQESFFNQAVEGAHHDQIVDPRIHTLMDFL